MLSDRALSRSDRLKRTLRSSSSSFLLLPLSRLRSLLLLLSRLLSRLLLLSFLPSRLLLLRWLRLLLLLRWRLGPRSESSSSLLG